MPATVTVHINKITGECQVLVHHDSDLPPGQHDAEGERITADIGRLLDRTPNVQELKTPEPPVPPEPTPIPEPTPTAVPRSERQRQGLPS